MRRARAFVLALVLGLIVAPRARAADEIADRRAAAKQLKDAGAEAMARRDFATALERFQGAYRVYPSPNLRYNIGLSLAELGRNAEAIGEFEAFLATAQDAPAQARSYAQQKVSELEGSVASVVLVHDAPPAQVSVDGRAIGETPLPRAIRFSPGAHEITVQKIGFRPFTASLRMGAGEHRRIDVHLEGDATSGPSPPMEEVKRRRPFMWVAAGTATALAAGGIAFGLHARSVYGDYETLSGRPCTPGAECDALRQQFGELSDQVSRESTIANVLFAGAGAAAVTAVVLYFYEGRGEETRAAAASSTRFLLEPRSGGASIGLEGRF